MPQPTKQNDADDPGLFPIRTVSALTGVNSVTLRSWERRYGLIRPIRKASGHRLYTREHIDLINRVVGLLDRGIRIGQVRSHLESENLNDSSRSEPISDIWKRNLNRMISGVIQFDEDALEKTYGEALSIYPIEVVTDNLLAPLLEELGRRWEIGEGTVAEEHFFGCYLRNKLGARFHHRVRSSGGPKLLLACLSGDRHETGLLLFALAANDAGYHTVPLGADMPLEELPAAAAKIGCKAIVLSSRIPPADHLIDHRLSTLVREADVPVFIGGRASVDNHDALRRAGVLPLGTDIDRGLLHLQQVLDEKSDMGTEK